jgi:hypothetical protein
MCPIPSCKRYSASASSAKYNPSDLTISDTSSVPPVSSGTHGIIHYPPRPTHHVTTDTVSETGSPLLDVNVEKIIRIVHREATRLDDETAHAVTAFGRVGLNDEEVPDESMLESPSSEVSASSSSLGRAPSKRQKHHLVEPDASVDNYRRSDPDPLDAIKKDMMSVLECDVCAMLLHEPVTTPCQHVRFSSNSLIGARLMFSHSARNACRDRLTTRLDVQFVGRIYLRLLSSRIIPSTRFS